MSDYNHSPRGVELPGILIKDFNPTEMSPAKHSPRSPRTDRNSPSPSNYQSARSVRALAKRELNPLSRSVQVPKHTRLTVRDVVDGTMNTSGDWGIKGYYMPGVITNFDKPTVFSIPKPSDKKRDFISLIQKDKKGIPGPIYNVGLSMLDGNKNKGKFAQGKYQSFFADIMDEGKKKPGVGKYEQGGLKRKIHGCFNLKDLKGGVVEEAVFKGMQTPGHYPATDFKIYKPRDIFTKIYKPVDRKEPPKSQLSPVTYRANEAYYSTQYRKKNIVICKNAKSAFIDMEIKRTKNYPGVGKYDITKSDNVVTLGLRRSYK